MDSWYMAEAVSAHQISMHLSGFFFQPLLQLGWGPMTEFCKVKMETIASDGYKVVEHSSP